MARSSPLHLGAWLGSATPGTEQPSNLPRFSAQLPLKQPPHLIPFDQLASTPGRFDAFIFDCDGTLADTMPLHHRAWLAALGAANAGFDFGWELFVSRAGMSLERTVLELNQQFETHLDPMTVANAQRAHFERGLAGVTPIQAVLDFARQAALSHPVSVASGSQRRHVLETLELIGARELFDTVITPADVAHGKPAPDMFLLAAERMGVAPERCLVLEDSALGVVAAANASMHVVLVPTPTRSSEQLEHEAS